ncbi:Ankyrin repeat and death domain-containing protein 1A [Colletotrichum tanaceti]|uniref:Ankyrin repeat and death domain-containing protein 1A n=1 Tax=Colletotrichum tanaceti TaxID=1306861 RepID=A0A4U6XDR3_9PEZI|nr:Ankyrin repeat and death domain-containing protein 1A [Colletotrichum tanaceti]TKW53921.1 Ankyrin repeat and death domain-containing protein 1A [Colletotrichum tanaceti]
MEVVGAVASFIAIGQALAAGRHIVEGLRAIPGIGNELAWLHNEIENLRMMVEEAKMRGTSTDESLPETPLLKSARLQLGEIATSLEGIHKGCIRIIREDGKVKAKKTKWFLQQKQLSECREKARDARANLLAALQTLQLREIKETKQVVLRIESFAIQTRDITALKPWSPGELQVSSCHLPPQHGCDKTGAQGLPHENPIAHLTTAVEQLVLLDNQPQTGSQVSPRGSDMITINASLSSFQRCPRPCRCRCHGSRSASFKSADWARSLIGSFSASYDQRFAFRNDARCDSALCKAGGKASANFSYRFPPWLCSWFIHLQASLNAATGISVSLRPIRLLPLNATFWSCAKCWSRVELAQLMKVEGVIYPGDVGTDGDTAINYMIRYGNTDAVAYLADLWADQLQNDSFDSSWIFTAHLAIEDSPGLPSERKDALRSMISRSSAGMDAINTPLHSAAAQTDLAPIQQAVKSQPWAMNQPNHCGETPLNVAVRLGNLDGVRELVRLGCDVNQRDGFGYTPLIEAARYGHVAMVQWLLDADCTVDAKGSYGHTALHFAAQVNHESSTQPLRILLSAGASVTVTGSDGNSVMHRLAISGAPKAVLGGTLRLLLDAGADLEACNSQGRTPLEVATIDKNLVGIQCLVEAGANTTTSNVIQFAALHSGCEELVYLDSLLLSGINLGSVDKEGDTAWDCFIYSKGEEDWRRGNIRRPSSDEQEAFIRLYKGIRDRNLDQDIKRLEWTRQYLVNEDQRGATSALDPLIKQKTEWERWEQVRTYKTIGLQVREGMWDAAIESVDENIDVLRGEMAKSPWDNSSYYDYLLEANSEDGETEDGEDMSEASITDYADEDETHYSPSDEESGEEEDDLDEV